MEISEIISWLREQDPARLEELWTKANHERLLCVGSSVFLRGLIEISNYCVRQCHYCGIRAPNLKIRRYRMTSEEVLLCARQAVSLGYRTIVLQAGEDPQLTCDTICDLIRLIKNKTDLAITISLGEREEEELRAFKHAGADRYLLRFETSDEKLYRRIHPAHDYSSSTRLHILHQLRDLGFEVGSGIMIGIPGQSYKTLALDIDLFRKLDLDMIGAGPYVQHPETPLARKTPELELAPDDQVPPTDKMAFKVVALSRLVCPKANIPATTALSAINHQEGRRLALNRGANVVMPNLTPLKYRKLYEIYPAKEWSPQTAEAYHRDLENEILSIGRSIGLGRGNSPNWQARNENSA